MEFVNGSTLTLDQLRSVYDGKTKAELLGCSADALRANLGEFIRPAGTGYADRLGLGKPESSPHKVSDEELAARTMDLLFDGDGMRCLSSVLPEEFEADSRYCLESGPTALDRVLDQEPMFDAIFFDCGEFSTLAEWNLLHERIRPGGLAMFHDVFFPKSIKCFILGALLRASEDWEILYLDKTTPQGLIVARKKARG